MRKLLTLCCITLGIAAVVKPAAAPATDIGKLFITTQEAFLKGNFGAMWPYYNRLPNNYKKRALETMLYSKTPQDQTLATQIPKIREAFEALQKEALTPQLSSAWQEALKPVPQAAPSSAVASAQEAPAEEENSGETIAGQATMWAQRGQFVHAWELYKKLPDERKPEILQDILGYFQPIQITPQQIPEIRAEADKFTGKLEIPSLWKSRFAISAAPKTSSAVSQAASTASTSATSAQAKVKVPEKDIKGLDIEETPDRVTLTGDDGKATKKNLSRAVLSNPEVSKVLKVASEGDPQAKTIEVQHLSSEELDHLIPVLFSINMQVNEKEPFKLQGTTVLNDRQKTLRSDIADKLEWFRRDRSAANLVYAAFWLDSPALYEAALWNYVTFLHAKKDKPGLLIQLIKDDNPVLRKNKHKTWKEILSLYLEHFPAAHAGNELSKFFVAQDFIEENVGSERPFEQYNPKQRKEFLEKASKWIRMDTASMAAHLAYAADFFHSPALKYAVLWDFAKFLRASKNLPGGIMGQLLANESSISRDDWENLSRYYFLQFGEDIDPIIWPKKPNQPQKRTYIDPEELELYNRLSSFWTYDALTRKLLLEGGKHGNGFAHAISKTPDQAEAMKYLPALLKIRHLDINKVSYDTPPALFTAINNNWFDFVVQLIENGANVNNEVTIDQQQYTPLLYAAKAQAFSDEYDPASKAKAAAQIVELLLKRGALPKPSIDLGVKAGHSMDTAVAILRSHEKK